MPNPLQVNGIVSIALTKQPGVERESFVAQACGGDALLLQTVKELLAEAEKDAADSPLQHGEKPGDHIQNYKLLQQIGEGGMGTVWMAEQFEPIRRRVALKIVKLGMDTKQVIGRFEAERQALALMDHPNIAKVLDAGATETGRPFFVMELVKGVSITRYCDDHTVSIPERLKLFVEVCRAVQHAHQKGVIHRDIKPSNILVGLHDGVPVPKVIDFGIAKATTDQPLTDKTVFTAIGQFLGTRAYMSPEQAELNNLDVDTRTDIYGLGVLLYELLTGKTPFEEKDLVEKGLDYMRRLIREQEPPRPSTKISTLSVEEQTTIAKCREAEPPKLIGLVRGDLDWVVMKALEKDRSRRYETANGLAMDVERFLANEPISARPPSTWYRLRKAVRRNRIAFTVGFVVGLVVLIGAGAIALLGLRAVRAEREQTKLRLAAEEKERIQQQLRESAESSASEAASQRLQAEQSARQVRASLSHSYFLEAGRRMGVRRHNDAVAYLAGSIRVNTNQRAQRLLAYLLTYGYWRFPEAIMKHESSVTGALRTSDEQRIITVAEDGLVRIWSANTGEQIAQTKGMPKVVVDLWNSGATKSQRTNGLNLWASRFIPPSSKSVSSESTPVDLIQCSPDEAKIATASFTLAQVWDARTGAALTPRLNCNALVRTMQFTPDSSQLVIAAKYRSTNDPIVSCWDATNGKLVKQVSLPSIGKDESLLLSQDGYLLLTHSPTNAVLWDIASQQVLARYTNSPPLNTGSFTTRSELRFSPNGNCLLEHAQSNVFVWQTNGALTATLTCGGYVSSASFSPDGHRIVTTSVDGVVQVWDAKTGIKIGKPLRHSRPQRAEFTSDGTSITTTSESSLEVMLSLFRNKSAWRPGVLRKFDYESGRELAPPFKALIGMGLLSGLRSPSWLSEGRVLDWSNPSNVVVWTDYYGPPSGMKLVRPKATQDSSPPKDIPLVDLSVVRNGISSSCSTLAAITSATEVSVWQFDGKQPAVRLLPHSESVKSVHVSDDGNSILTTSAVGVNLIGYKKWNSHTGELLSSGNFRDPTFMISFSPDLSTFVGESGAPTNCARIYDASSLTPLAKLERNDQRLISKALFCSQTNLVLATAIMPDYFALLYKVDVGTHRVQLLREIQLPQFDPGYATYTVASPRGTYVAVYSPLHPTRLFIINFERESQQSEPVRLKNPVQSIQFSSDETLLFVSERGNNSFRIWDVETGLPLTRYFRCEKPVVGGAFYDDDSKVAVLLSDGSVQTWSLWPKNTNPPDWLPSLAEAVAGLSLNFNGVLETKVDAATEIVRIREQLAQETGDNDWNSWGRWFLDIDQQRRNSTAQAALNFDSFPFPEDPQSYEAAPER